ncbi:hypothetical protein ATO6_11940 [Oceanicola sp. 22II-s10i]|uniref:tellurite resistance TerB family protein n=1 Tax=Oceanicola sp. 22II-s10i TaxID=1317116 RepID=UPI000B51FC7A|nr:TerB family tellurite resistance protein [Oceanicola sp. 22II-s10i]OWU84654.1 hypothetical protein ATO6_11940 [Oceanicola sp. 22II-s10i]
MFADFLARLTAPNPSAVTEIDARLALTALLVRVARSDGTYDGSEKARILKLIEQRYGLTGEDALALRAQAETLEAEAPDTVRFTRAIKDAVPLEERIGVIEALWSVVMDDGSRHQDEDALMRLVANLLGIGDAESNAARLRVSRG